MLVCKLDNGQSTEEEDSKPKPTPSEKMTDTRNVELVKKLAVMVCDPCAAYPLPCKFIPH